MAKARKDRKPAAQVAPAKRAQELKAAAQEADRPDPGETPDEGMQSAPRIGAAPSGALDAEGQRPVLERSRKAR